MENMEFLHGRALDNDGEELIQIGLLNGRFRLRIGGKFIADYKTEEQALNVKKTINEALFITYGSMAK